MRKVAGFVLFLVILNGSYLYAGAEEHPAPYVGSAEFERLKALAGTWKGIHKMGEKEEPTVVEYAVTSNGSAVLEKFSPGTPHEMISVYHDNKGKLSMTHYCGLANRPQMDLISSNEQEMKLDFSSANDIDPATEAHMHSLAIKFDGNDQLTQTWAYYKDGAEAGTTVITLTRQS